MRTWPPSTLGAWYSSESFQQTTSGSQAGTVMAMVPPGLSTRASSAAARSSSGMCSMTSAAMIRSKVASGNGSCWPSATAAAARPPAGASPTASMAAHIVRHSTMSARLKSAATTRTPASEGLVGVATVARAEVEQELAGAHAETVVVDGEHPVSPA